MAVLAVNENPNILKNYEIKLKVANGQCSPDIVLKSFIDYIRLTHFNRMVGILGKCETLFSLSHQLRIVTIKDQWHLQAQRAPILSNLLPGFQSTSERSSLVTALKDPVSQTEPNSPISSAPSEKFENSSIRVTLLYRWNKTTSFQLLYSRYVFLSILQQLGWKRVGALMADGKKYSDYMSTLQDYAESNKINFITPRKIIGNSSREVYFLMHVIQRTSYSTSLNWGHIESAVFTYQ